MDREIQKALARIDRQTKAAVNQIPSSFDVETLRNKDNSAKECDEKDVNNNTVRIKTLTKVINPPPKPPLFLISNKPIKLSCVNLKRKSFEVAIKDNTCKDEIESLKIAENIKQLNKRKNILLSDNALKEVEKRKRVKLLIVKKERCVVSPTKSKVNKKKLVRNKKIANEIKDSKKTIKKERSLLSREVVTPSSRSES